MDKQTVYSRAGGLAQQEVTLVTLTCFFADVSLQRRSQRCCSCVSCV